MPEPDPVVMDDVAEQTSCTDGGNRFQVLGYEQVNRLHRLMDTEVPIHGRGNFPTLQIKLRELVQVVRTKLKEDRINVRDIRLNGGAASFILGNETSEVRQTGFLFDAATRSRGLGELSGIGASAAKPWQRVWSLWWTKSTETYSFKMPSTHLTVTTTVRLIRNGPDCQTCPTSGMLYSPYYVMRNAQNIECKTPGMSNRPKCCIPGMLNEHIFRPECQTQPNAVSLTL